MWLGWTHFPGVTRQFNTWQISRRSVGEDKHLAVIAKGCVLKSWNSICFQFVFMYWKQSLPV